MGSHVPVSFDYFLAKRDSCGIRQTFFLTPIRTKKTAALISRAAENVSCLRLLPLPILAIPSHLPVPVVYVLPVHAVPLRTIAIDTVPEHELFVSADLLFALLRSHLLAEPVLTMCLRMCVGLRLGLLMLRSSGSFLLAANCRLLIATHDSFEATLGG